MKDVDSMKGIQVSEFNQVERVEKRFVLAILMAFVTSIYNLAINISNMDLQNLVSTPLPVIIGLILTAVTLVLAFVAILEYIKVSLVFERKVEIKQK